MRSGEVIEFYDSHITKQMSDNKENDNQEPVTAQAN